MTTLVTRGERAIQRAVVPDWAVQAAWYIAGAVLGFALPSIFTSVLDIQHDLFYLIYFASVGAFLGAYVRATHADVVDLFRRGWKLSLAVGALTTVFVVFNILQREDATPRPDGAYFGFELVWRGLLYGVVDSLLLTAFPMMVAYALFGGKVTGITRRVGFAAVALVLIMAITATYHLGYSQYREDGVANPEIGNVVISIPALVSTNPLGSVITHAAQHVTAVTHAYETPVFLPPQTDAQ